MNRDIYWRGRRIADMTESELRVAIQQMYDYIIYVERKGSQSLTQRIYGTPLEI